MKPQTTWVRAAAAIGLALCATASAALDLMGSYERALATDPGLLAAGAALQAGREKAVQGQALLRPQIGLSAGLTQVDDRSSTDVPPALQALVKPESSGRMHQVAVQLTQPLYNAKAVAEREQLTQQAGLAEIRHRDAQQDLMQRVAEAYFGVLLAQENLQVVQAEAAAVALQRERAQARFDLGRAKVTDVQEAQARVDSVATKQVSAQGTLALRQAQYRELTGAAAEGLAPLRPDFKPAPPQPDDLPHWQGRAQVQNLRVQARRGELAIAAAETGKYTLGGRPTLDLVASLSRKGQHGGLPATIAPDNNRTATLGLQWTVPLYAGGALDSRQREAVAKHRRAEHELAAAQRDARLQVQDAFVAVKTGAARVAALQQSVLSARTALEATTLGRDVGTRTPLDVLDAQQRLYATQLDLAQARHDHLLGRIRLASAAGELQEGDLRALNAQLVP